MTFSIKATYKEETRTIAIAPGPDSFPAYADVQDKLRAAFSLPSSTKTHWWHVGTSAGCQIREGSADGPPATGLLCSRRGRQVQAPRLLRRRVCALDLLPLCLPSSVLTSFSIFPCTRYQSAKGDLVAFAWPRPTLAFQVLIAGDPRLSTAEKYHKSTASVHERDLLIAKRAELAAGQGHLAQLVAEIERKRSLSPSHDALILAFWDGRLAEQRSALSMCVASLKRVDALLAGMDKAKVINQGVLDKENGRNAAAKRDIEAFCCVWGNVPRSDEVRAKFDALRAKAHPPIVVRSLPVPLVAAAATEPSARWSSSSIGAGAQGSTASSAPTPAAPASPFPNLDAVLDRLDPDPSSAFRGLADKVKEITGAQAQVISQEIKQQSAGISHDLRSALDGFLNNLTSQLNTFEDGFKERHRPVFRETGVSVAASENGEAEADISEDQFPGAFVRTSHEANRSPTGANKAAAPASKAKAPSLYLSMIVCDVCDQTPKAVRWHCDVSRAGCGWGTGGADAGDSAPATGLPRLRRLRRLPAHAQGWRTRRGSHVHRRVPPGAGCSGRAAQARVQAQDVV